MDTYVKVEEDRKIGFKIQMRGSKTYLHFLIFNKLFIIFIFSFFSSLAYMLYFMISFSDFHLLLNILLFVIKNYIIFKLNLKAFKFRD